MSRQLLSPSRVRSLCGIKIFYCELMKSLFHNVALGALVFQFLPFSETTSVHAGLLVEVWSKNIILDRAIGFQFVSLESLPYNQYDYPMVYEQWFNIDAEQVIVNGEVQGTRDPTGHMLLLDLHFELPFGKLFPLFKAMGEVKRQVDP